VTVRLSSILVVRLGNPRYYKPSRAFLFDFVGRVLISRCVTGCSDMYLEPKKLWVVKYVLMLLCCLAQSWELRNTWFVVGRHVMCVCT